MRSEIPQLEVITAISDAETEDFVSQLLFSQGWSIIFRAIDGASLKAALFERGPELRTVIIYRNDLPGTEAGELESFASSTISMICIDDIEVNSHKLMVHIRGQLRMPLVQQGMRSESAAPTIGRNPFPAVIAAEKHQPKIVTVTGTAGAPGRSHVAYNLANYLSWQRSVQLIDADLRSPSLAYLMSSGKSAGNRCQLLTMDLEQKPIQLPSQANSPKEVSVIDIGALPPIKEVITDRRWQACLINNILESSSSLVFVTRSSGLGLMRLQQFIADFPILLRKIPIIYVLNQSTTTREDRAIESRFLALTAGEERFVLPHDHRPVTGPRAKSGPLDFSNNMSRLGKEIGKIAAVVS